MEQSHHNDTVGNMLITFIHMWPVTVCIAYTCIHNRFRGEIGVEHVDLYMSRLLGLYMQCRPIRWMAPHTTLNSTMADVSDDKAHLMTSCFRLQKTVVKERGKNKLGASDARVV